jgi:hypothetical protein
LGLTSEGLPPTALSTVYELVVNYFTRANDVLSDGIYVLGALASYFQGDKTLL